MIPFQVKLERSEKRTAGKFRPHLSSRKSLDNLPQQRIKKTAIVLLNVEIEYSNVRIGCIKSSIRIVLHSGKNIF